MEENLPHILVVDDDNRLRELLYRYLQDHDFIVTTAADAADARAKLKSLAFDLLIVDVMMPGEDGLSLTTSLREDGDIPILLLTARGEPEDRIKGLEAGADDYLPKPFEPRELLLRINSILRRRPVALEPASEILLGNLIYEMDRDILRKGEEVIGLTSAEANLLRVLTQKAHEVISRDELLEAAELGQNVRTVDVQVTRLRRKIEPDPNQPIYLQTIRGQGYVLRPD